MGGAAAATDHLRMRNHHLILSLLAAAALSGGGASSALADDPNATHDIANTASYSRDTCNVTNWGAPIPGSTMLFHDGCTTWPRRCEKAGGCGLWATSGFAQSWSTSLQTTQNMRVRLYNNGVYVTHYDYSCARQGGCSTGAVIASVPLGWSATVQCNGTRSPYYYQGWPMNITATNSCQAYLYWPGWSGA
jgi:hypothetical protein